MLNEAERVNMCINVLDCDLLFHELAVQKQNGRKNVSLTELHFVYIFGISATQHELYF